MNRTRKQVADRKEIWNETAFSTAVSVKTFPLREWVTMLPIDVQPSLLGVNSLTLTNW
ncbi:hypothetical protein [Archangium violaceum]|uniref:hypothetical protein n=1 Tax=Archangium violaceum TaxID=83451 RepID=UPI001EF5BA3F|nr:hypothetical protein [Archangium violaceum]